MSNASRVYIHAKVPDASSGVEIPGSSTAALEERELKYCDDRSLESERTPSSLLITLRIQPKVIEVIVYKDSTVTAVKIKYLCEEIRKYRNVQLLFGGKELLPNLTLEQHGIKEGSVVDVHLSDPRPNMVVTQAEATSTLSDEEDLNLFAENESSYTDEEKQEVHIGIRHRSPVSDSEEMHPLVTSTTSNNNPEADGMGFEYPRNPHVPISSDSDTENEISSLQVVSPSEESRPRSGYSPFMWNGMIEEKPFSIIIATMVSTWWVRIIHLMNVASAAAVNASNNIVQGTMRGINAVTTVLHSFVASLRRGCRVMTDFTNRLVTAWSSPELGPDYTFVIGMFIGLNPTPILLYSALRMEVPKLCIGVFFGLGLRTIRGLVMSLPLGYPDGVDPKIGRPLTIEMLEGLRRGRKILEAKVQLSATRALSDSLYDALPSRLIRNTTDVFNVTDAVNTTDVFNVTNAFNETEALLNLTSPTLAILTPPRISPVYTLAGQRLLNLLAQHGSNAITWIRDPLPPYYSSVDKNFIPPESEATQSFPMLFE